MKSKKTVKKPHRKIDHPADQSRNNQLTSEQLSGFELIRSVRGMLKGNESLVEAREREHRSEDEARHRKLLGHFRTK